MRYGSVCSGIEAASCAWEPLGWRAQFFSEIEAFPSAVLAHHYPNVPNYGDMNQHKEWPDATIDVLVGGTPCQSFSVAGLRKGLRDPRGNLALVYLALVNRMRPRWFIWENVPGVLSSDEGRDFGAFLGAVGELGYGFAYRVLDAQYYGVAQRRRRVFVVGYLGDWRPPAAVLFEPESLRGDSAPGREARKVASVSPAILAGGNSTGGVRPPGTTVDTADSLVVHTYTPDVSPALKARDYKGPSSDGDGDGAPLIAHTLRGEGFDAGEDGSGRGTPLVPFAFTAQDHGADAGPISPTLRAGGHAKSHANGGVVPAVAFAQNQRDEVRLMPVAGALSAEPGAKQQTYVTAPAVRRLTPRECERLQGFPDDYTLIEYRGKPSKDGPRYKAIGNSMAVPVMRWLGERIEFIEGVR